jgi:hypothetical protein
MVSVKAHDMEILLEPGDGKPLPEAMAGKTTQIGTRRRMEVKEAEL